MTLVCGLRSMVHGGCVPILHEQINQCIHSILMDGIQQQIMVPSDQSVSLGGGKSIQTPHDVTSALVYIALKTKSPEAVLHYHCKI